MKNRLKNMTLKTLLTFSLVGLVLVGGTVALLTSTTTKVTNTFDVVDHATGINEEVVLNGDSMTKTARVMNETNDPAYVRVRVEVSPEGAGEHVEVVPTWGANWSEEDENGFYYYQKALSGMNVTDDSDKTTDMTFVITPDDGFTESFEVNIYSESCYANDVDATVDTIRKRFNYISTGKENESEGYTE